MSKEVYMLCDVNGNTEKRPIPGGGSGESSSGEGSLVVTLTKDDYGNYVADHTLKEIYDSFSDKVPVFLEFVATDSAGQFDGFTIRVPVLSSRSLPEDSYVAVGGSLLEIESSTTFRFTFSVVGQTDAGSDEWHINQNAENKQESSQESSSLLVVTIDVSESSGSFSGQTSSSLLEVSNAVNSGSLVTFKMNHGNAYTYFIRSYEYTTPDAYNSLGRISFKYEGMYSGGYGGIFSIDWSESSLSVYFK